MTFDPVQLAFVLVCLAGAGIVKGAAGVGAPLVAIPALATLFDVRFAVVVMAVPNLFTNLWQVWTYRQDRLPAAFTIAFAAAGTAGVIVGTAILAYFPQDMLSLIIAVAVFAYITLRLARPEWQVVYALAARLAVPAGLLAGALQGASGISAPVSISFLNAMRLERRTFISTISVFFFAVSAVQVPALASFGILSTREAMGSLLALLPILAFMPVGAALARRFSAKIFDRAILGLLVLLAVKLVFEAIAG